MDADQQARSGEREAGSSGVKHETNDPHEINSPQQGTKTAKETVGRAYWQAGPDRVNAGDQTSKPLIGADGR